MRSDFEELKRFAIADILSVSGRQKTTETVDMHINTIIDIAFLKGQQASQSKVDELEHKAKLRESDHKALLVKYQATKKCWEDISKEKEELQTQLSLQRQRVKAFEEELTNSRNYGDELQKRVDAALQLVNEMKGKRYPFSAYADQLEQALKGGSDE